jgi:hypothetical protein
MFVIVIVIVITPQCFTPVFLNRRAVDRYQALVL